MNNLETITLREKQQIALDICKENHRFGVFFDMSTGKTATMLSLIDYLVFEKMEVRKILITAPSSVVKKTKVWQKEIAKWKNYHFFDYIELVDEPKKRVEKLENSNNTITLISDSLLDWFYNEYKNLDMFDMIIVDESSRFKNVKTNRFKALSKMLRDEHRLYLLTGTPRPNGFQDLWSQIYLLDKGKRLGSNYYSFIKRYAYYVNDYRFVFLKDTQKVLEEKIKDICMFADGGDIILPKKHDIFIQLDWGDEKQKIYKEFEESYVLSLKDGDVTALSKATYINKTLQLTNGCVYVDRERNYETFDDTKLKWIKEFSQKEQDNMLVFYLYKFDKERLLKLPNAREIKDFKDVDDWNDGKIKIGIISPSSFQYGGNLQYGGNVVVWYGLTWNLENFLQSNKRVWRYGQKKEVRIYYLFIKRTNDEYVYKRLTVKDTQQEDFLESIKR